jgi:acyl-CoA thioesterase-1
VARAMAVATVCLTMASCGGKPEEPEPAPRSAAPKAAEPVKADARPVIVTFGDSLSAGFGVDAGLAYPDFLQKELDSAGYSYRVVNESLSGDTSSGGVSRVASVLVHKPVIVILELGANDGLRGIPVASTRENLDQIITELTKAGAKVLLLGITLPRNYGMDYIKQFDRTFPELAKKHNARLLPFMLENVALNPNLMQRDALHPTAEGNRVVAGNVMKALQPLLDKKSPPAR